jgi:dTMP kinase
VTRGLLPDRTFLLLVPLDRAVQQRGANPDRIEREGEDFIARVDTAYRELAGIFAQRVVSVDATPPPDDVAETIRGHLRDLS